MLATEYPDLQFSVDRRLTGRLLFEEDDHKIDAFGNILDEITRIDSGHRQIKTYLVCWSGVGIHI